MIYLLLFSRLLSFFSSFFLSYNSPLQRMEIDSRPEAELLPDCVRTPPSKGTIDWPTTAQRITLKSRKLLSLLNSQPFMSEACLFCPDCWYTCKVSYILSSLSIVLFQSLIFLSSYPLWQLGIKEIQKWEFDHISCVNKGKNKRKASLIGSALLNWNFPKIEEGSKVKEQPAHVKISIQKAKPSNKVSATEYCKTKLQIGVILKWGCA